MSPRVHCPVCRRMLTGWPPDLSGPPYCDYCEYIFPPPPRRATAPEPARPEPEPPCPPQPAPLDPPLLVAPHRCNECQAEIHQVFNQRSLNVSHTLEEGHPVHHTAIYAMHFRTPCCSRYVELPRRLQGLALHCPACREEFTAPRDDVINRRPGDIEQPGPGWFRCPCCQQALQCNHEHQGRPLPGHFGICTACYAVVEVPQTLYPRLDDLPPTD